MKKQADPPPPEEDEVHLTDYHPPALTTPGAYRLETVDGTIEGLTNLDLTTHRGKALFVNAGSPGDVEFDVRGYARILATCFVLFADEGTDRATGELRTFTRTVLFDKDGNSYRTTSDFAPRRLRAALALWNADQWSKGIQFVIRERRTKDGQRTYHDLRVEL